MRIPPLPTTTRPLREGLSVTATESARAASPVEPRSLPPLVYRPVVSPVPPPPQQPEKPVQERRNGQDRRQHCRRHQPLSLVLDPRQWGDRRKYNRRAGDQSDHVDEWA
ncbi:hypothetical protein [Chitinivorax sp. B]|uniref:hypothetical protein n=1 Tax=Chitinivorax sp. B TaxID=2502235 RepID=UPI0010F7C979|nr:hypothetical protein [Chitinivorax sp. B]